MPRRAYYIEDTLMAQIDTSWSKLIDTPMGNCVHHLMDTTYKTYHNFNHVKRLYALAKKWNLPYDINLDAAILWHDSVYDAAPDKEVRSIRIMLTIFEIYPEWFVGIDTSRVDVLIRSTIDHVIDTEDDNLMIKLDLAELGDPVQAKENFWNILEESKALYGINIAVAAQGTVDFMSKFAIVVQSNLINDLEDEDYWTDVTAGVRMSKLRAATIVELQERYGLF
jgi:predicted metal-dependent HD superfamily phosphohydrolase